ncbi:PREDICTED: disease resistance protein RML1A-like [Brassica oleracea var. oleracea]|uniref:ADP-ribosyl cyclase/cyclic ADP-ribose hydrolase n=1 Tax=Brassica oleracea var. oleracea TaxID=109376 RepID=A0A0D3DF17_BRAOL|nr:PREDICTED: disease resistance protein RML1A-like [Brassica oleracea var. oleracea]
MDSSSPTQIKTYHVYPSFCAPDVGRSFFSHLRSCFASKGITMFNDHGIERGHTIGPEVVRAIRDSQVSIVVLSNNYPSSSWCLDELVEILKFSEVSRQMVMPIYYNIDPSDVRKQSGSFGSAFMKTCEGQPEEVKQRWSKALTYIASIAGVDSRIWDNESAMIQNIATYVSNTLSRGFDGMVGLKTHLEKLESLLSLECSDVKMIGIWGPAGIGKTTIARALFNKFSTRFPFKCFMGNLEGDNKNDGVDGYDLKLRLQNQLLSKILNQKDLRVRHLGAIKEWLLDQKVFIILDGVYDLAELEALAKDVSWFGYGSRIIVTTEDKYILRAHGISDIYYVDFPSEKEAIEILCLSAFRQSFAIDGFEELASRAANLCGNLPLGLSVVGSSLRLKSKHEWELQLCWMKASLDKKIENVLRMGYDRLMRKDQSLFIQIACFFNNEAVDYVTTMLANKNLDVRSGLKTLADKSLVQISTNGRIVMHALLQQLGRQLVLKQFKQLK